MISIRASSLDDWRRYQSDDMTAEELTGRLRGNGAPSAAMRAGTALGAYLANPSGYADGGYPFDLNDDPSINYALVDSDGQFYRFDFAADISVPAIRFPELSASRRYIIGGESVCLTGHADGFDGFAIEENKLTQQLDAERYADSYQWRAYLVLFGAKRVNYNVFIGKEMPPKADGTLLWLIRDFRRFSFYRYAEIEADVERILTEFLPFVSRALLCSHEPEMRLTPSEVPGEPDILEECCIKCGAPSSQISFEENA